MAIEMKDTGIEWIGKIPKEWDVNKIKYSAILKGRIGWQGLTTAEYRDEGPFLITGIDFADGSIDWEHCEHVELKRWAEDPYIQITNGDLLITKDGTVGKTAIVEGLNDKATLNSGVLLIRTDDSCNRRYLYWILNSQLFWKWFNVINSGNSTIIHLYQGDFNNFVYPVPDITEQKKIADILDTQTSKVDAIIKTNEQQLEILKKYKKSLITQTVTKGLDKNVKMKDSGVDGIGQIPEGWEISRLKYHISIKSGDYLDATFIEPEGKIKVYGGGEQIGYFTKANTNEDCILIGRVGARCGCVTFPKEKVWATDNALIVYSSLNTQYLYYLLDSSNLNKLNTSTAQPLITGAKVKNLYVALPRTKEEQMQISTYLDNQCSKIDSLITKKQQAIDTMQKYKKSLIYEYVTGKERIK